MSTLAAVRRRSDEFRRLELRAEVAVVHLFADAVDLFTGNNNIYVRVFDPSLNFVREDDIDLGSNQTFHPALTALAGGSYAVSYTLTVGTNTFIEGRIVSATGDVGGYGHR